MSSGETLYAAGIASETRFVATLALNDEGTPTIVAGGLSSSEMTDGDAPFATAVACSSSMLAAAVNGKSVSLFDLPGLSLQRTIAQMPLPVRALGFSLDEKLMCVDDVLGLGSEGFQ